MSASHSPAVGRTCFRCGQQLEWCGARLYHVEYVRAYRAMFSSRMRPITGVHTPEVAWVTLTSEKRHDHLDSLYCRFGPDEADAMDMAWSECVREAHRTAALLGMPTGVLASVREDLRRPSPALWALFIALLLLGAVLLTSLSF